MISCCIIFLVVIVVFILLKYKNPGSGFDALEGLENTFLEKLYPAAYALYRLIKYRLNISIKVPGADNIKKLYTALDNSTVEKLYFCKLFSIVIAAVSGFVLLLAAFVAMPAGEDILQEDYYIKRDKPEGQDKTAGLDVSIGSDTQKIVVDIPARKYSGKEYRVKLKEAMEYVRRNYLGENKSPGKVSQDLNLVSSVPGNAISVSWEYDTGDIVGSDGALNCQEVTGPEVVQITAIFTYFDKEKRMPLEFTVLPVQKSRREKLWDRWHDMFTGLSEATASKEFLQLPSGIDGIKISYRVSDTNYIMLIIISGIFVIAIIPVVIDSRIKEKVKQREQELSMDYPGFVERFVLLTSAGLNCKGAWYRMTGEYKRKLDSGGKKRYLYEEMLLTERQLENGMNEAKAYELFGKRMGLLKYMKFCTLLVQNLKKGSADLLKILEYESADVLKERRENARILGEQAGTKMLMPMVVMMAEVFAIIIFAAFQNM